MDQEYVKVDIAVECEGNIHWTRSVSNICLPLSLSVGQQWMLHGMVEENRKKEEHFLIDKLNKLHFT